MPSMTAHAFTDVRLHIEGGIAKLVLARPGVRNALRTQTCHQLTQALAEIGRRTDVRLLWLSGEGGSFCAGADLTDATVFNEPGDQRENARKHLDDVFHPIIKALRGLRQPSLAVIPGAAVGFGFDLACACDLRVAAADAKLGPVFNRIGLVPDGGGTWSLPRLIGPTRALEWILTGHTRTAAEVESWGFLNRVVPADRLEATALTLAQALVDGPPLALAAARRLVYAAQNCTFDEALSAERDAQGEMIASTDCGEGVAAFFERRPPRFKGE